MKRVYEEKVKKMILNYEDIRKFFRWENDMVKHLVALTFAMKDKAINPDCINEMKGYIKSQTSAFSSFRGHMMFTLSGLLCAASPTPKRQFDVMLRNEKVLKDVGFKYSSYLPTALYALSSVYEGDDVQSYAEKAIGIYKQMKQNHPFLTGGDDYALAVLLANTDHGPSHLEAYYRALHERGFKKGDGLQMLSHVMAFNQKDMRDAVDHCDKIYQHLKTNKLNVYTTYYPAIGLISLLDLDQEELMADLVEVATYLKSEKKYRWLGKGMHVLMASSIIASQYLHEKQEGTVVNTTVSLAIQAIIAAQQVVMISAATSAAATSSST